MCVGVLLSQELDKQLVEKFRHILQEFVQIRDREIATQLCVDDRKMLSTKIADFIVKGKLRTDLIIDFEKSFVGGEKIAWGVTEGAERANRVLSKKSERYRNSIVDPSTTSTNINPAIRSSFQYAYRSSKGAVRATRYLRMCRSIISENDNIFRRENWRSLLIFGWAVDKRCGEQSERRQTRRYRFGNNFGYQWRSCQRDNRLDCTRRCGKITRKWHCPFDGSRCAASVRIVWIR